MRENDKILNEEYEIRTQISQLPAAKGYFTSKVIKYVFVNIFIPVAVD